jgi:8-oxo-dGTP pyrophosphatase MutT (NUDIX family)
VDSTSGRRIPLDQAGGIVWTRRSGRPVVLMVSDRHGRGRWLFPKGDIDEGESAAQAARRETYEEAAVKVTLGRSLGTVAYRDGRYDVKLELFLQRYRAEAEERLEKRERVWVSLTEAARRHHLGPRIVRITRAAAAAIRAITSGRSSPSTRTTRRPARRRATVRPGLRA